MLTASLGYAVRSRICSISLGAALCVTLAARGSKADVASWLFVGGGATTTESTDLPSVEQPALFIQTGLGSNPAKTLVLGGLFRTDTHFGQGTDLGIVFRACSGSYARGDYGLALDLGGYQRFWKTDSSGVLASLSLGGPWGLVLSVNGQLGTNATRGFGAIIGLDFARLTVHRTTGRNWFDTYPSTEEQLASVQR